MEQTSIQRKTEIGVRYPVRLMFIFLITSCMSIGLSAQQTGNGLDNFQNQWFIGFGLGPRLYFADHARQLDFIDRLSLGADLYVGKWWSPILGTRIGVSYQTLKGAAQNKNSRTGPAPHAINTEDGYLRGLGTGYWLFQQKFDAVHLYGDLLFDVSNLFEGVYEDRFWTLAPFIGIGYMRTVNPPYPKDDPGKEVSFNVGLLNILRVGRSVDLTFDIRGALVSERIKVGNGKINPEIDKMNMGERPFDGILSVNLGVAFRFGGYGNPKPAYYYPSSYIEPVRPVDYPVEVITEWKDVATDVLILFRINQSTLLQDARVQLNFLARLMHEYPEGTYTITGYADEGTGNPDLNLRLSRARAERVKECLVGEFGISPTRLKTVAAGGIENRYYNDPSLSRSVIIRPDKY